MLVLGGDGAALSTRKLAPNPCRDCGGPKYVGDGLRCSDCQIIIVKKKERSAKAHAKRVSGVYGITADEYAALLAYQNGVCFICHRKPGKKRLAVDHDHELEKAGLPKRETVRGLLCRNCNFHIVGMIGGDPAAFERAQRYLTNPPAREVLR